MTSGKVGEDEAGFDFWKSRQGLERQRLFALAPWIGARGIVGTSSAGVRGVVFVNRLLTMVQVLERLPRGNVAFPVDVVL